MSIQTSTPELQLPAAKEHGQPNAGTGRPAQILLMLVEPQLPTVLLRTRQG